MMQGDEIQAGDIVFECPHCGKSLAIEAAGAGMEVPCTDCGQLVRVPVPETELTPEEAEDAIAELDAALNSSADELVRLREENEMLRERKAYLEHVSAINGERLSKMAGLLDGVQRQLDELVALVADARTGHAGRGAAD